MPELTPLCELAKKYGTDKGGWHTIAGETCHNYTPFYHMWYGYWRHRVTDVLEIGVHYGCSVRMWEEYFPNARIWGLDSNAGAILNEGRIHSYAADQGRADSLLQAIERIQLDIGEPPRFDLIVDDGSHEYPHQIISMQTLLPFLRNNGLYVIEDTTYDCQPEMIGKHVPDGYWWEGVDVGVGIGKAHCDNNCPHCHGKEGERLVVIGRK